MAKRALCILTAVVSLVIGLQSYVLAQSPSVFGPAKYTRTTGAPNTYSDTFQICNTGAIYKLLVENGEAGKNRISSAVISLNGQEIIGQNEFSQKVDKIEKTVSLQQENTLDIKIASGPGGFIKVSVYCVANCLEIKITSPAPSSTINKARTLIKGDLYNAFGETGVVLQSSGAGGSVSESAQMQSDNFAGIIPLQQGQNTITATATDACGYKTTDAVTINTQTLDEKIRLTANPESGIPTLRPDGTTSFSTTIEAEAYLPSPVTGYSWDTKGDGIADQTGATLSTIQAKYTTPGLYFPTVTVTDALGITYTETAIINVLDRAAMDALLKAKWEGMKTKLANQDVEGAVSYFVSTSQERYRDIFTALSTGLPALVQNMHDIQLIYLKNNAAKYRIRKNELYGGQTLTITYYIYFEVDNSGIWRIGLF